MSVRGFIFCLILVVTWVPAVAVLAQLTDFAAMGSLEIGTWFAVGIAQTAPIVVNDASLIGQLSPVAVAGVLGFVAPDKDQHSVIYAAIGISVVGWLLYLALSVVTSVGANYHDSLVTIMEGNAGPGGFDVFQSFVTAARVFYLIVGAGLLGIRVKGG
jgi:hypothetical protein